MKKNDSKKDKMSKKSSIIIISLLAVVLTLLIIFVVFDQISADSVKLRITNDTDKNISDMVVFFQDDEGNIVDTLFQGGVKAGDSFKEKFDSPIIYRDMPYECVLLVTFEGEEELRIYDGSFSSNFGGTLDFKFFKEGEDYYLHARAGVGAFNHTVTSIDMDDDIILFDEDSEDGWDYVL